MTKHKHFPERIKAFDYFCKQAAKNPKYLGLLHNRLTGWYEVMFSPPKDYYSVIIYSVIKLHGVI